MVLCVDAGNTNIVLGGYQGGRLVFLSRIATQPALQADQYALQIEGVLALHGAAKPQGAILSSVVPHLLLDGLYEVYRRNTAQA